MYEYVVLCYVIVLVGRKMCPVFVS